MFLPRVSRHGFALLLSLAVTALLTVVLLEADFQARTHLRAAGNFRDDTKAFYLAQSAILKGQAQLTDDKKEDGKKPSDAYDGLDEPWAQTTTNTLGGGTFEVEITDEAGKFNLNALTQPGYVLQLKRLFKQLGIEESLVDDVADWIDPNDTRGAFGSEAGYYQQLDLSYVPSNQPFQTMKELRLVAGITPEIYRKLLLHVTVYRTQPNDGKININTASRAVIQSFGAYVDDQLLNQLIAGRPYKNLGSAGAALQNTIANLGVIATVRSDIFSLVGRAELNKVQKTIRAVYDRSGKKTLYLSVE